MSNKQEPLPFPRGESHPYAPFLSLLGREYEIEDDTYGTGRMVRLRLVRNTAASVALPARLQIMSTTANLYGIATTGMAHTTAQECYPADEKLPSAGAAVDDAYYVVVGGPALIAQGVTTGAPTLLTVGAKLVSQTAATSGATTAGRVELQDLTGATAVLGGQIQALVGRALSAKTTSEGGNVLVNVGKW